MQAGLNLKAADYVLLFVQFFASRASSCCKHDMGALLWLNANIHLKEQPPSFWQSCKVLCQWVLFCDTTVLLLQPS